ncbi:MAG: prepilin peptidase [Pseudomonadota bacterium]
MADPDLPEVGEYSPIVQGAVSFVLLLGFFVVAIIAGGGDWASQWAWMSVGLALILVVLAAFDMKAHILPDALTLPLLLAGLVLHGLWPIDLLWSGVGAVCGYGLIAGLRWIWMQRRGIEAIGLGDAKMLAAGGAWVGAAGLPIVLLVASGSALIVVLLSDGYFRDKALPFGVFLAVGIWASWCFWVSPQMMAVR